jgi:acyl-CoA thioesterase-1
MILKKCTLILILLFLSSCGADTKTDNEINKVSKNSKIILALWDSITAWYQLDLEDSYPSQLENLLQEEWYNYRLINAWVSWDTSDGLLERIDLYLDDDENIPEIAILVIWWNDWLRGQSTKVLSNNIKLVIEKLEGKNIKVVLPEMQIPPNLWLRYTRDFKNLYKKVALETGVYSMDFFLEWVAWNKDLNLRDGIHPNKKWYEIISKNVFNFLKSNEIITND